MFEFAEEALNEISVSVQEPAEGGDIDSIWHVAAPYQERLVREARSKNDREAVPRPDDEGWDVTDRYKRPRSQ